MTDASFVLRASAGAFFLPMVEGRSLLE